MFGGLAFLINGNMSVGVHGSDLIVRLAPEATDAAEGRYDRLPALADELVQNKVDLIMATPSPAAVAAKNATTAIPIVMASVADPAGLSLIARPRAPGRQRHGYVVQFCRHLCETVAAA